ncbi:Cutinase-like protein 8 [Elsinoe fawcettii]|nr:Cutinase-like protein 8 [Elsinoe fawcettii]
MKFTTAFIALFAAVSAMPTADAEAEAVAEFSKLEQRAQLETRATGNTVNELSNGACRAVTFIFARASTETGNIGSSVGPPTCDGLKSRLGANNVACQGVGGPYTAALGDNALPSGTTQAAINEAARLFTLATTKCPNTKIVGGGYSQGAAVIHGAAKTLSSAVQNKVVGLVTYGDTRKAQDNNRIPPFPASKTKIICNAGDGVCTGTLVVTAAHLAYQGSVGDAVSFLVGRVNA